MPMIPAFWQSNPSFGRFFSFLAVRSQFLVVQFPSFWCFNGTFPGSPTPTQTPRLRASGVPAGAGLGVGGLWEISSMAGYPWANFMTFTTLRNLVHRFIDWLTIGGSI